MTEGGVGQATLIVLAVIDLLAVFVLVIPAIANIRDAIVKFGFVKPDGKLGRQVRTSRFHKVLPTLEALGLDEAVRTAIRKAAGPAKASKISDTDLSRPDLAFLKRTQSWIRILEQPYAYKSTPFYLDLMGAIDGREDHELGMDQIFCAWIEALISASALKDFDILIAPKDGNVLLSKKVADALHKPLILCKGVEDKSRIDRPDAKTPHDSDFEGFRALYKSRGPRRSDGQAYRALIIDDSCKNGSQLAALAKSFNALCSTEEVRDRMQFAEAISAVVLFRSLAGNVANHQLNDAGVSLHALVAVGPRQLELLSQGSTGIGTSLSKFKDDPNSCEQSIAIFGKSLK